MASEPKRTVENNLLVSSDLPPIKLKVDGSLDYIGRLQFGIYGIADADVFMFGSAAGNGMLRQWLLVQFECYRDNNDYSYTYPSTERVTLGQHEYQVDYFAANLVRAQQEVRPDSDFAQEVEWLKGKGLHLPGEAAWARFVYLLGEDHRREMLVIYTEDLSGSGWEPSTIAPDEEILPEYAEFTRQLRERALGLFTVVEG